MSSLLDSALCTSVRPRIFLRSLFSTPKPFCREVRGRAWVGPSSRHRLRHRVHIPLLLTWFSGTVTMIASGADRSLFLNFCEEHEDRMLFRGARNRIAIDDCVIQLCKIDTDVRFGHATKSTLSGLPAFKHSLVLVRFDRSGLSR